MAGSSRSSAATKSALREVDEDEDGLAAIVAAIVAGWPLEKSGSEVELVDVVEKDDGWIRGVPSLLYSLSPSTLSPLSTIGGELTTSYKSLDSP